MKKRIDWREVGGAPLVGVNGVGFISHGRSDALAIENAIRRASRRGAAPTSPTRSPLAVAPVRGAPRARRTARRRRAAVPTPAPRRAARRLIRRRKTCARSSPAPARTRPRRSSRTRSSRSWSRRATTGSSSGPASASAASPRPSEATSDLALQASHARARDGEARSRRTSRRSSSAPSRPTTRSRPPRRCCRASWATRRRSPSTSPPRAPARSTRSSIADRFVATGAVKNALVVGADTLTRITDWTDRNTCILFGDGAGAMVLKPDRRSAPRRPHDAPPHRRLARADPATSRAAGRSDPITREGRPREAHYVKMNGREVFKVAVRALEESCREVLAAEKLTPGDVTYVIAHQANKRILDATLDAARDPRLEVLDEPREVRQHLGGERADDARRGEPRRLVQAGRRRS